MGNFDDEITRLAASQRGAFHRRQVLELGHRCLIEPRVKSGRWIVRTPGVYSLVGAPDSWRQRLWVGLLDVGDRALASHESAGRVNAVPAVPDIGVVLSSDRPQAHRSSLVTLHRPTDLIEQDRTVVDGFPVTTVERTIIDLASVISRARLSLAVQGVVVAKSTTPSRIGDVLLRVSKRGKPGVRQLAAVLDELAGESVPRSELERRLDRVLARTGLSFTREQPLPTDGSVTGFVDRMLVTSRLIIEADGRKWHGRLQDQAKDRSRDEVAAAQGFQTLRFTWDDVVGDPDGVVRTVLAVVARRHAA